MVAAGVRASLHAGYLCAVASAPGVGTMRVTQSSIRELCPSKKIEPTESANVSATAGTSIYLISFFKIGIFSPLLFILFLRAALRRNNNYRLAHTLQFPFYYKQLVL